MADYAYYPGCTLYTKGRELDRSARRSLAVLGVELREMPSWVCCGAIYNTTSDDFAGRVGATRNIVRASALGDTLVTLCAACYNVLKRAKARIDDPANAVERERVLNFIDEPYEREVRVVHYLDVLKRDIGWEAVQAKVARPLAGLRLASYYGCLMVRPATVLEFDDPENPQVMDELARALGAEPVRFDFKTECCGGYLVVNRKDVARDSSARVLENARAWGADAVITTCPLCQYNLDRLRPAGEGLPVLYFTQLLALALGLDPAELGFDNCAVDPRPMLAEKGLL
ncbi:MAG: CoB--CoM heterodisulfide reductase iron-sulfur subunit B family protein [bacterium]